MGQMKPHRRPSGKMSRAASGARYDQVQRTQMHARAPLVRVIAVTCLAAMFAGIAADAAAQPSDLAYGNNPAAANTFVFSGTRFYYETYGQGTPVLLIHGNAESIGSFKSQIGQFASHHRVIAMDSRGLGKSELGTAALTYEQMAEDTNALLEHMKL